MQTTCTLCSPRKEQNFTRAGCVQLKIAGACYLLSVVCGMSLGHTSVLLRTMPSSIPTDSTTAHWIDRVQLLAVPAGCLLGGIGADRCGRQRGIMMCSALFLLGWCLTAAAQNHAMIFIARVLNGLCSGAATTLIMVTCVEYCDHKQRAPVLVASHLLVIVGAVVMYGLGLCLDWRLTSGLAGLLSFSVILTFHFLPESAVWLVRKYRMIEARRTLLWLHGPDAIHQAELEHEDMVQRRRVDEIETFTSGPGRRWRAPHILKPFLICLLLNAVSRLFCAQLFTRYGMTVYRYKGEVSTHYLLLLTEVLRAPGLAAATVLLYWIKRRSLVISSGIVSCIVALAVSLSLTNRWLQLLLVVVYITSDSWGFHDLPLVMTAELISSRARGVLCGLVYTMNALLSCIALFFTDMELVPCELFWVVGIFCLLGTLFACLFVPETRGQSLVSLEDYYKTAHVLWIFRNTRPAGRAAGDVEMQAPQC